jgi:hypothetical protein
MQERRDRILARWRREADEEASERTKMVKLAQLFPSPKPRHFCSPEPTQPTPSFTESELFDDDVSVFERPPVVIPENTSQELHDRLAIPVIERLFSGRRAPVDPPTPGRTLSAEAWRNFMHRQRRLEDEKRRRDRWRHHSSPTVTDGRVFDRLFEDSLIDRNAGLATPDKGPVPETFGVESRRIVAEMRELPSEKRRERNLELPEHTRPFTFDENSRRICDRRDPSLRPFLQRAHRDWDFNDVMEDYRRSEAEAKKRKEHNERLDV